MAAQEEDKVLKKVTQALENLRYGTVQITVHNARVTQIDRLERVRVHREDYVEPGSGI